MLQSNTYSTLENAALSITPHPSPSNYPVLQHVVLASRPNLVLAPIYLGELGDGVVDAETFSSMPVPSTDILQRAETMLQ